MEIEQPNRTQTESAPSRPGTWKRPTQRGFRWTIGRKLAAVVAVAITAGFAATVALQASIQRADLYAVNEDNNRTVSALLAREISGAVQWKKAQRIEEVYSRFATEENSIMASFFAFDATGEVLAAYQSESLAPYDLSTALESGGEALAQGKTVSFMTDNHQAVIVPVTTAKDGSRVGTLAIAWSLEKAHQQISAALSSQIRLSSVILLSLVAFLWLLLTRVVSKPIKHMTEAMGRLAEGDNSVEVPARERGDEIGAMAGAVQVFKDNAIRMAELQTEQAEAERRAEEEKRRAMTELADTFEANVKGVVDSVSSAAAEMQATAQAMSATAEQTSRQGTTVASASEQATANVQTVATAAEELSSSFTEISRQVAESAEITRQAVAEAERTNGAIQGLATAAQKIGEVVDLINDIAGQTNLLALNATIEAARAGDAGKGFAVVASEVKNLANQTARATDEIAAQIGAMQEATDGAVTATEGIGKIIANVNEIAASIASAVEQQQAATSEISRNVQEAAQGTQEVSGNIASVNEAAKETGSAAGQLLEAAGGLSRQSEVLRAEVDKFVAKVRAG